jgi:hypothetical protein
MRKILNYATITLHISRCTGDDNATHTDISQQFTGGIAGTAETRTLDWTERFHKDHIFGRVKGRSRWVDLSEVLDWYLRDGWEAAGWVVEGEYRSEKEGSNANVIWGFANVGGKHYLRKAVVQKRSKVVKGTYVYDRIS